MYKFFVAAALILISSYSFQVTPVCAGTLSCNVSAVACTGGQVEIYRMSGTTNAHAQLPSVGTYTQRVCCSGVTGLSNACTAPSANALNFTKTTNSHSSQTATSPYTTPACISVPSGGSISIGYQASNCTGFDTTLGSMSSTTNAHVGDTTAYTTKICGTAGGGVPNLSISGNLISSVFDSTGSVDGGGYNSVLWKGTLGTGSTGKVRFQFAASDNTTGPWSYIGGGTCAAGDWFDPGAPDTPIELKGATCQTSWNNKRYFRYKIQICSNDCVTAGPNTPTVTDVAVSWAP